MSQPADGKPSLKGLCRALLNFWLLVIYFERLKLDISYLVCRLFVGCTHAKSMHAIYAVCSGTHDCLQFWKTSVNTSKVVQDRDIVTTKD